MKQPTKRQVDPTVQRRMELVRRSFTGTRWKSQADQVEYNRLVNETMVLQGKKLHN